MKSTDTDPRNPPPTLHSLAEAARMLGISLRSLQSLVAAQAIHTVRPTPRRVMIAESDLVAYIQQQRS